MLLKKMKPFEYHDEKFKKMKSLPVLHQRIGHTVEDEDEENSFKKKENENF